MLTRHFWLWHKNISSRSFNSTLGQEMGLHGSHWCFCRFGDVLIQLSSHHSLAHKLLAQILIYVGLTKSPASTHQLQQLILPLNSWSFNEKTFTSYLKGFNVMADWCMHTSYTIPERIFKGILPRLKLQLGRLLFENQNHLRKFQVYYSDYAN